ncbi:hypothetical protein AK812_SmicGene42941 [Symbiodinium microadriaticum]|uniref:Uncharacterized protein n=1 Tax=Symbiodinium microadriaticum TaxID=2951 RepID=A0A1Q9C2C2_SYMMI|nr:hypothetical protein AK812_SmicGene42941 [Symbiodinium microadriaticum]
MRPAQENGDHEREHWESLLELCEGYRELHAAEPPLERRALSWARCLAFAQVALGARGCLHRRSGGPRVIWVLAATDEVEGALAEQGYFKDAAWLDRAPTQVIILGNGMRQLKPTLRSGEGQTSRVRISNHQHAKDLPAPHLAILFMPDRENLAFEPGGNDSSELPSRDIPREVRSMLVGVPVVVSTCFKLSTRVSQRLSSLGRLLLLQETRCPFSASAGDPESQFSDNSWITAVEGPDALDFFMNLDLSMETPPFLEEDQRIPAVFWGILDLKYDGSKPILERVRVLETGDGRISKFSGDGAALQDCMKNRYTSKESGVLRKFHVISADKKLTHDLMELAGYGHIVPGQCCYPRHYHMQLADQITADLELEDGDKVVLKLCNRSRAAGVIVAPVDELDEVLEEILIPPEKMDGWLHEKSRPLQEGKRSPGDFDLAWGSFEEQKRHWWANESPCFVAERWCTSTPVQKQGKLFDGTMRVGFVILYKRDLQRSREQMQNGAQDAGAGTAGPADIPQPEELAVHWLGGYWKLPKRDMCSSDLRERVVSAARTSGTAPVRSSVLAEVYSALGDSVQQLFGGVEPTSKMLSDQYDGNPELAAYLTARLAVSNRDHARMKKMLYDAQVLASKSMQERGKHFVESFLSRCHGVLEARSANKDRWEGAKRHFVKSLKHSPSNANALYLLGMCALELGKPQEAVSLMTKSLLLDPDFRAPYVCLGVAFLRLKHFEEAISISEACLDRHPSSPQCVYHIGVACCQLSLLITAKEAAGIPLDYQERQLLDDLRKRALASLTEARESEEGQKRKPNPGISDGTVGKVASFSNMSEPFATLPMDWRGRTHKREVKLIGVVERATAS